MTGAVSWRDGALEFLDQTLLPHREVLVTTTERAVVEEAIRSLKIRGAPAIGIAAAYGVCLAAGETPDAHTPRLVSRLYTAINELSATRPTAVNLFAALERMRGVIAMHGGSPPDKLRAALIAEAREIHEEDARACAAIGSAGADLLPAGAVLMTYCNAGALATGGIGTALGVITTAAGRRGVRRVYAGETRPLLQGARLTAWELLRAGIETVLITDAAAGSVLRSGEVDAVITGADRIAANGDVANKVGTYPLAVLAHRHRVPVYIAAPLSTIDAATATGDGIPIEERSAEEVTHIAGVRTAAEGVRVFAPAFDVTPHELITAVITEKGVLRPPFDRAIAGVLGRSLP